MNARILAGLITAAALATSAGLAQADHHGQRIENRMDARGDRAEDRLDERGDRIEQRMDARGDAINERLDRRARSEEHTSELQSLMRNSYAVFCLKKNKNRIKIKTT